MESFVEGYQSRLRIRMSSFVRLDNWPASYRFLQTCGGVNISCDSLVIELALAVVNSDEAKYMRCCANNNNGFLDIIYIPGIASRSS